MAVQYASVQTTNNLSSDTTDITITKPTSLAVGDLMVAHITYQRDRTFTPATGWSSLAGTADSATTLDDGAALKASVQWKVADSSDVAASNFSWTITNGRNAGAIYRIIGQDLDTPIGAFNTAVVNNTTTPSFGNTITPVVASSLLLMLNTGRDQTAGSAYAIVISNPTWTERYDMTGTGSYGITGATATRPEITATGNSSYTPAGAASTSDYTGFLIAISPEPDPTLTPGTITINVNVPAQTLSVPYTATPNAITVNVSVLAPTLTVVDNPWTNVNKNTSTWVNENKS